MVKVAIEVGQTECKVIFDKVEVTNKGEVTKEKITGGLIPGVNELLKAFIPGSKDVVVEAVRKDIEKKIQEVLGNGLFNCESYDPNRLFHRAALN